MVKVERRKRPQYRSRVIMESILGRKLRRDEHVHHKDGNPLNDEPENLEVLNISDHGSIHSGKIPDDVLMQNLIDATNILGHAPTSIEWDEFPFTPHSATYRERFGSWYKALEEADIISGMEKGPKSRYLSKTLSDQEILERIQSLAGEIGRKPTYEHIEKYEELPSSHEIKKRFGSIPNAIRKAGVK